MFRSRGLPGFLASAVACFAIANPAAATPDIPCFEAGEIDSAQIHEMRVMMLVTALKCRELLPATMNSYGQLMRQRDGEFRQHADRVQRGLVARYGPHSGRLAFADYETLLGNYHSNGRLTFDSCGNMGAFVRLLQRASSPDWRALSNLMPKSAIRACPAPDYVEAKAPDAFGTGAVRVHRGFPARVAREYPPVLATAAAAAEVEPETDDHDLMPLATRVAPVTPLAKVDPSASKRVPSESERLAQAIKALDTAAAALREMQSQSPAEQP